MIHMSGSTTRTAPTCAIVDDEESSRRNLLRLLDKQHPDLKVLGTADGVAAGIELVKQQRPDILFLDIDMGGQTGFDLLRALGEDSPHVIFTTAHESYAVKAIRFSALDYLLKPIDRAELDIAIEKARRIIQAADKSDMYEVLLKNMDRSSTDRVLALPVQDGLEMVHVNEIVVCEADAQYTTIHMRDKSRMVISRSLGEFEELLQDTRFLRVHHGSLVNRTHIKKYIRGDGGELIMSNGMNVAVSKRKKADLLDGLDKF